MLPFIWLSGDSALKTTSFDDSGRGLALLTQKDWVTAIFERRLCGEAGPYVKFLELRGV